MTMSILDALRQAAAVKTAADPGLTRLLLAGGAGAAVGAIPTAMLMHRHEQAARDKARNVGFGAGVATGISAPHIIHALHSISGGVQ
jgi:hypothetical protein